ncbi:metal-dependent hydrolase [Sphingomonas xanthus]|uniref:Metal-dependent hydrolase n=1 Tax=Sphingomonas xanthus TaxID=2594473 RepID=A0A516IT17_9SPHN|nr:metal-dependent hydrolase [Sphingomonas xanthus]QDP20035.1 metal-dependent hydrolase [Sphingomonas xanthus]
MDNLTHGLVGAMLGQMGLKRLSGRAMATLVIAGNIPDIDALTTLVGTESLALRRGITHGPIALAVLPVLLAALVIAYDRWRPCKVPLRPGPLIIAAYIGTLSHPALDWLNSYGIRLLEPFSSRWFAGDTLFIIDIWVWVALTLSFLAARRSEKRGGDERRIAWMGFAVVGLYIFANGLFTGHSERATTALLEQRGVQPALVVANPVPGIFWQRKMLWRDAQGFGQGQSLLLHGIRLPGSRTPLGLEDPLLAAARERPDVRAFLFWSRMPIVIDIEGRRVLTDQRFTDRAGGEAPAQEGNRFRYNPFTIPLE